MVKKTAFSKKISDISNLSIGHGSRSLTYSKWYLRVLYIQQLRVMSHNTVTIVQIFTTERTKVIRGIGNTQNIKTTNWATKVQKA